MSVTIEKEFYIPETFDIVRRFQTEYDNNTNEYTELNELTDEYFTHYVNQKGSYVYYLNEQTIAKTDTYQNLPISGLTIDRNTYSEADYRSFVDGIIIKDPRGFEFKISIRNFLYLCRHHNIECGEIKAECVLSWSVSGYLTLLSTSSESYKSAVVYTNKQSIVFDPETLEIGKTYFTKKSTDELVYIGKHKINSKHDNDEFPFNLKPSKLIRPVFYNKKTDEFITLIISKNIAGEVNSEIHDVFDLINEFKNSVQGRTITSITFSDFTKQHITENKDGHWSGKVFVHKGNNEYIMINYWTNTWRKNINLHGKIISNASIMYLIDGTLVNPENYCDRCARFDTEIEHDKWIELLISKSAKVAHANFEDELSTSLTLSKR
ncbi:hypothetical protein [Yersinia phage fHe-Yen9-04]|uniref:Uncharacterized protein n=1 Tax=Yersinia phage fHe-Yen9-04 TaxID=2052742 RepID=A0A2C9CXD0_9CAUD|nr:hypothetical protein FDJ41_gp129 [Yersinia phage fHe-Yen9-04]SOK58406.1 hypothetical protein [Yersinia phage fHe-Yen9-04]VUE36175.1 hypothetical protein [Yersinia phage fHe-Yen9-04]